jgi:hypothetical protein
MQIEVAAAIMAPQGLKIVKQSEIAEWMLAIPEHNLIQYLRI